MMAPRQPDKRAENAARKEDALAAIRAELIRLGLSIDNFPGGGLALSDAAGFLERLRSLPVGSTWRDVDPSIPAHWEPGRPETWTTPYRPLGPYDYQELPTGAAIHIHWDRVDDPQRKLDDFLNTARAAGWPIYGAGLRPTSTNPNWPHDDADIVLRRGAGDDTLHDFTTWIDEQSDVSFAGVFRREDEENLT